MLQKKLSLVLPVALEDSEIIALTFEALSHEDRAEALKIEAKSSADAFKDKITAAQVAASTAKAQIRNRTKDCEVACREFPRDAENLMLTIRMDTGAEVARRPLEEHEKQESLLETAEPITAEDLADRTEHDQIANLFQLADSLEEADLGLGRNLQPLWNITEAQAAEARLWLAAKKETTEGTEPPPMPGWLEQLRLESRQEELRQDLNEEKLSDQQDTLAPSADVSSNGQPVPMSRGDLCDGILECGCTVRIEDVELWSLEQARLAEQWVRESRAAIQNNTTRKAAPNFFFPTESFVKA